MGHRRWFLIYATVGEAFLPGVYLEPSPQDYTSDYPTWTLTKLVAGSGAERLAGRDEIHPTHTPLVPFRFDPLNQSQNSRGFIFQAENPAGVGS